MIGVIAKTAQINVVEEFFELFKTPWELYCPGRSYDVVVATSNDLPHVDTNLLLIYSPATSQLDAELRVSARSRHRCAVVNHGDVEVPIYGDLLTFMEGPGTPCITAHSEIAGVTVSSLQGAVIRLGYDLFDEVQFLLSTGQPSEYAHLPTLDFHIRMLREWIVNAGISLIELPPAAAGHSFAVCLTHDIDFIGIRNHVFDHSMWGFVYRATAGAVHKWARRRLSLKHVLRSWLSAASLPFVYLGWAKDFWEPFEWYLRCEKGLPATYFLIPFKGRAGENVPGGHASRRATAYDVTDVLSTTAVLKDHQCEVGVHGIDSWHSISQGQCELRAVAAATGQQSLGIRMHWLLQDAHTSCVLDQAGYAYDSTVGYNDTVGYRAGTSQVFKPLSAQTLLELPLHIQDGALFYPQKLNLTNEEADKRCRPLIDNVRSSGGVLTVLWHDRSHGPERFWGGFYVKLLDTLKSLDCWFGTAAQVVKWFRQRRQVRFEPVEGTFGGRIRLCYDGDRIQPPLRVRFYTVPNTGLKDGLNRNCVECRDVAWDGTSVYELDTPAANSGIATTASTSLSGH